MKQSLLLRRVTAMALALITLLSTFGGSFAYSVFAEDAAVDPSHDLDFTNADTSLVATAIPPSELLILSEGEASVSEAERIYLDTLPEWQLSYNAQIPHAVLDLTRVGTSVNVAVAPYSYTAKNGATVTFEPTTITCDGETVDVTPTEDVFTATLTVAQGEYPKLSVEFEAKVEIPADLIGALGNAAFEDATEAIEATDRYEAALDAYVEGMNAYSAYLDELHAYDIAYVAYQSYLTALKKYNEAVEDRKAYEAEYAKYEEKLKEYEAYLAQIKAYEDAEKALAAEMEAKKAEYERYEAYLAYLSALEKPREVLSIFESVYVYSATGKQMYATLMGPTVTSVIDRRDELIELGGVSEEDINNAGNCTDVLRALLTEYTTIEGETAKYLWYTKNYVEVRDNFTLLCTSLKSLFENYVVKAGLRKEGKYERYCEFLSHLYMISTALEDSVTPDPEWTVDKYKLYDILEKEYVIDDRNIADPRNAPWPKEMPKVEKPVITTVLPPYPPAVVPKPIPPTVVPAPGEPPKAVTEPTKPTEYTPPDTIPEPPYVPEELKDVISLVLSNHLSKRSKPSGALRVTLSASLTHTLMPDGHAPILYFHNAYGELLVQKELAENVLEGLPKPNRPSDVRYRYTFAGWKDRNGNTVDLSTVTEDTDLYPMYSETERTYSVNFSTYAGEYHFRVAYGKMPQFSGDYEKPAEGGVTYLFVGWDQPIRPADRDVTYTAHYVSLFHPFTVKWQIGDTVLTERYYYGEIPECPVSPKDMAPESNTSVFKFTGWDKEIRPVDGDIVYTAVFKELPFLPSVDPEETQPSEDETTEPDSSETESTDPEQGGSPSTGITVTEKAGAYTATIPSGRKQLSLATLLWLAAEEEKRIVLVYEERCTLELDTDTVKALHAAEADRFSVDFPQSALFAISFTLLNTAGEEIPANGMRILLPTPPPEDGELFVCASPDGDTFESDTCYSLGDKTALIVTNGYTHYRLRYVRTYAVSVVPSKGGVVTASRYTAPVGETVTLSLSVDVGLVPSSVVLKTENGTLTLTPNAYGIYTFEMPEGDVQIEATFAPARFTVEFYVDGELYEKKEYTYGDELILPKNPTKEQESDTVYTFEGWSPDIAKTVTADAVYEAVFKTSKVASEDEFHVSPYTQILPVKLIVIASATLAVVVGGIVALSVWRKKRQKIQNS